MPVVLTIDQKESRGNENRVPAWVERLNQEFRDQLELPFVQTAGDEMQALAKSAEAVTEVLLLGIRGERWWVGIGLGSVESPLGESSASSQGTAFYHAREAVIQAKESRYGFAVIGEDADRARAIAANYTLIGSIAQRRGTKRWEAIDLVRKGLNATEIGERLGISPQAAWQRLRSAAWEEECQSRWLAAWLMAPEIDPDA